MKGYLQLMEFAMVTRFVILLTLPWLVLGCSAGMRDPRTRAAICARSWKAKGFAFDPSTMTCDEMFERAQAIRNAAYWRQRRYTFDPNTMTAKQMDRKAAELRKMKVRVYPPAVAPEDVPTRRMLEAMTLAELREQYPQYNDMDDMELARGIHGRYFGDVSFDDFAARFLPTEPGRSAARVQSRADR
ncbi:hypothetical protein [Anaerobaca lacustris]|uniref:Lipoprotein n=1 Tax=Anaerobaca lacustris TaxID=3044600 RepID=A0AAW6U0N2_9BACT|nr:hypothetical protein [Sedimentisphaerales bacterium M17dextr]